jgi:hypothetical protein
MARPMPAPAPVIKAVEPELKTSVGDILNSDNAMVLDKFCMGRDSLGL